VPSAFLRVRYIRCTLATPKQKKVSPRLPPRRSRVFLLFSSSFSSCPRVFLESPRVLALSLAPSSSSSRRLWKALQNETTPLSSILTRWLDERPSSAPNHRMRDIRDDDGRSDLAKNEGGGRRRGAFFNRPCGLLLLILFVLSCTCSSESSSAASSSSSPTSSLRVLVPLFLFLLLRLLLLLLE